jgi:hypothetical protein
VIYGNQSRASGRPIVSPVFLHALARSRDGDDKSEVSESQYASGNELAPLAVIA